MLSNWLTSRFNQIATLLGIRITPFSKNASPQGTDPMQVLPAEILTNVFSHLGQNDCISCLTVSRHWYNVVPLYSHAIWKELRLHPRVAHMDNHLCEPYVANRIKSIVIEPSFENDWAFLPEKVSEQDVFALLKKCLDWGCDDIESIELMYCSIQLQSWFQNYLEYMASNLKRLKIIKLYSWLSIPHLFYTLPELSHFTYQSVSIEQNNGNDTRIPLFQVPSDYRTKITYLCLSLSTTKEWKESIARLCPNLRCFIDESLIFDAAWGAVDLDSLLTWCPNITFLKVNAVENRNWQQDPDTYISKSQGLQLFDANDTYGFDQIARQLTKSHDTLQYLRLHRISGTIGPDWSLVFASLQLPKLRHLILRCSRFSFASFASMLNHCLVLESIALFYMAPKLLLEITAVQSLQTMQHLRCLQLDGILDTDGHSLLTMLGRFPFLQQLFIYRSSLALAPSAKYDGLEKLKFLDLSEVSWKYDGDDMEAAVAHFFTCLTTNGKLESLRFKDVPTIGRNALQVIAKIPSLKYLDLLIDHDLVHEQDLLEFIGLLRDTVIDILKFINIDRLTFPLLEALAQLPRLSMFCTGSSQYFKPFRVTEVDKDGLTQMLSNSPNLIAIVFNTDVTVTDGGKAPLTEDQLLTLIKDQRPPPRISRCWNIEFGHDYRRQPDRDNVIHSSVVIKWFDVHFSSRFHYGHSTKVPPMF
ncbi:hypothetical protein BJV82DRAFT_596310 [Fennellomyces sp. T-0311]|nr:hypothetical protein BJV82DRAFT_596310 [Fennellomyces sp. T-0311]